MFNLNPVYSIFFVLLVVFVPHLCHAQQPPPQKYIFRFDSTYRMQGASCFDKIKLADNRVNKEDVGYVRNYTPSWTLRLPTQLPFVEGFQRSSLHLFDSVQQKIENTLLIVLYDFELGDYPNGNEVGTFHLSADYFIGNADSYHLVSHVDTLYEVWDEWHVTKKLMNFAGATFNGNIGRFAKADVSSLDGKIYTEQSAASMRADIKRELPIYNTKKYSKGICYTRNQFLQNAAVDTPFIKTDIIGDDGINLPRYYYENARGKKGENIDPSQCYAIYSGLWYLSTGNRFVILKNRKSEFYANMVFMGIHNERQRHQASAFIVFPGERGDAPMPGLFEARFDPVTSRFVRIRRL